MIHLRIVSQHEISVADPALVRELLVTNHDKQIRWERGVDVFSKVHGQSVFTTEGNVWHEKRRVLQPNFQRQAVHYFVPQIVAATNRCLTDWVSAGSSFPIERALTSLTMDVILQMMVSGGIGADARRLESALKTVSSATNAEMYWPASWPDWMPWKAPKRRARALLRSFIGGHVQERLRLPNQEWPDDLLARLLHLHRGEPATWTLNAVQDECMTTFLAGHATTAETLTWWAWCMAANPKAQATARAEVEHVLEGASPTADSLRILRFLTQTLEETMRLYPVAPLLFTRRLTAPVSLGHWNLPVGTLVAIPVQVIHHDPRWYPEPLAFLPQRFAPEAPAIPRGAFLPFGTGPRVCLGQNLAMAEMTVIAAMILQRFSLSVPHGMLPPQPTMKVTLRPGIPLNLKVAARF